MRIGGGEKGMRLSTKGWDGQRRPALKKRGLASLHKKKARRGGIRTKRNT